MPNDPYPANTPSDLDTLMRLLRGLSAPQPRQQPITITAPQPNPIEQVLARTQLGVGGNDTVMLPNSARMLASQLVGGAHDVAQSFNPVEWGKDAAQQTNEGIGNWRFGKKSDALKNFAGAALATSGLIGMPESDYLASLLGRANAPEMRQGARAILRHEVPGFGGPLALNATREAVPGRGTGALAEALLNSPADVRAQYSQMASEVPVWSAANRPTMPSFSATGSFQPNPDAPWETNPMTVSRPIMETTRTKPNFRKGIPGNELTLKQGEIPLAKKLEALAGLLDMQNANAAHVMLPGGGSGFAALGRPTTPEEMKTLLATFTPQGFSPVDVGRGVSLMNFSGTEADLMHQLPTLNQQLQQVLPDASAIMPSHFDKSGVYNDFTRALDISNAGNSTASRKLKKMLTGTKDKGQELINTLDKSSDLRQAALDRNERDAMMARDLGVKNRDDIMELRDILGNDGLKKLIAKIHAGALGLPAAAVMMQRPDSLPDTTPDQP